MQFWPSSVAASILMTNAAIKMFGSRANSILQDRGLYGSQNIYIKAVLRNCFKFKSTIYWCAAVTFLGPYWWRQFQMGIALFWWQSCGGQHASDRNSNRSTTVIPNAKVFNNVSQQIKSIIMLTKTEFSQAVNEIWKNAAVTALLSYRGFSRDVNLRRYIIKYVHTSCSDEFKIGQIY